MNEARVLIYFIVCDASHCLVVFQYVLYRFILKQKK